jgi:hypothetical protein
MQVSYNLAVCCICVRAVAQDRTWLLFCALQQHAGWAAGGSVACLVAHPAIDSLL